MELTRSEKAFIGAFATFVAALLVASSVTGSSGLYIAALISMLPSAGLAILMTMPVYVCALILTDPLRAAGFEGTADVLAWRGARNCILRSRDRFCSHAPPPRS